jgi:hypothetical protein
MKVWTKSVHRVGYHDGGYGTNFLQKPPCREFADQNKVLTVCISFCWIDSDPWQIWCAVSFSACVEGIPLQLNQSTHFNIDRPTRLCISSCEMKKNLTFRFFKRFNRSSTWGLTAVQPRFARSDWGLQRFDFPIFYSFRFIFDEKSSTFEESRALGRTWVQPRFNRSLTEVWGSTLIAVRVIHQQKVKKTFGWTWGQTSRNMFNFAENRSDRSRTAVELKLDQQSNQGSTFIADGVILDF